MRHLTLTLAALGAMIAPIMSTPAQAQLTAPMTLRDRLVVVSSISAAALAEGLTRGFAERYGETAAPILHSLPTARAVEVFCAGTGPQTPDMLVALRRMPRAMIETCNTNGVRDIIEMDLGLGAVVLAVRRGEATPALTSRQVWEALAAERHVEEEFVPNRVRAWSDISPTLPRAEIRMMVPDDASGNRALFDDLVMEAGCRNVRPIRLLFEATYRRAKCITQRTDGRATSVSMVNAPSALLTAPPGTIGVLTYEQVSNSGGNFVALSLDGVVPTAASIANFDYEQTRTVYLYAKRQHARNQQGVGVVRGIQEFLNEAASEGTTGPGGYLTSAGLVPLGPAERAAQRRVAETQTLMSR
ncbi:PstS family phosphate ABC transporter substrate-binding protein [Humitalea sp. 24SJ18S-53]|uniref:PstS family phosphate ABC transporter substrate-binding protein n=1 Tax=Humitalea sp. 24SJ18S-53 TaxID=3422307 RepID=UPI003D677C03